MKVESLQELEAAFTAWRQDKRHPREKTPLLLLVQAREAAKKHGVKAVVKATGIDRQLLGERLAETAVGEPGCDEDAEAESGSKSMPAFSQLLLSAPAAPGGRPLVELESPAGVKLRIFEHTPELLALLAAACGFGGDR
jgi:hypothetical protein